MEDHSLEFLFLFIILSIIFGVFFKFCQKYVNYEYSPILLVIGIIIGIFYKNLGNVGGSLEYVSDLEGHSLLMIFMPLLIFESSFNVDTYTFMKSLGQILLLAFPGVIMSIFLVALTLMYILGYNSTFNWGMALSLSSILAATDPVTVIAVLKNTGAKIKLSMLIEGESLLNDGSAAIFFFVFVDMVLNPKFSLKFFTFSFARLTFGGILVGLISGVIFTFLSKNLDNDKLVVVFSFLAAYLTFFVAEASMIGLHVSGILSVVVLGLYLGANLRPKLNPHHLHTLHSVWGFAGFIMETALFLLTGAYIGEFIQDNLITNHESLFDWMDVLKLVVFNFLLLIIRFVVVAIWWPALNCIGYKITWKEYIIMSYAGLRGAIGLALGLFIALDNNYPKQFQLLSVLYISGVIFFTVFIQGMTLKPLMRLIGYNRTSSTKLRLFNDLHRRLFLNILEKSDILRSNKENSYLVSWESIYEIFSFPKYILDLNNIETQGQPLMVNYDYDEKKQGNELISREDYEISDAEETEEIETANPPESFHNSETATFERTITNLLKNLNISKKTTLTNEDNSNSKKHIKIKPRLFENAQFSPNHHSNKKQKNYEIKKSINPTTQKNAENCHHRLIQLPKNQPTKATPKKARKRGNPRNPHANIQNPEKPHLGKVQKRHLRGSNGLQTAPDGGHREGPPATAHQLFRRVHGDF